MDIMHYSHLYSMSRLTVRFGLSKFLKQLSYWPIAWLTGRQLRSWLRLACASPCIRRVPPSRQKRALHYQRPTETHKRDRKATQTALVKVILKMTYFTFLKCLFVHAKILTHCISRVLKMRGRRNILTGTVMMRTNGKASDATVDMTAQRTARQTTCIAVYRCIRRVRTWGPVTEIQSRHRTNQFYLPYYWFLWSIWYHYCSMLLPQYLLMNRKQTLRT